MSSVSWSCFRLVVLGLALLVAVPAAAQITENNPRLAMPASRLHRPTDAPIFVAGRLGVGAGFQYDQGNFNYGAELVFRPGQAAHFWDFLYGWNAAMVLQIDHQKLAEDSRLVSGDLIVRKYFRDRGRDGTEVLPFLAAGFGASDVTLPAADGGGNSRYWSWLVQAGQEWYFRPNILVAASFQYRHFKYGPVLISSWEISGSVGIPAPW